MVEDFVSAEEGTGVVHMAPAFGADDYVAGQKHGLPMTIHSMLPGASPIVLL